MLDVVGDGSSEQERREVFEETDKNGDELLDFEEFLEMVFGFIDEVKDPEGWDASTANPIHTAIALYFGRNAYTNERLRGFDLFEYIARRLL